MGTGTSIWGRVVALCMASACVTATAAEATPFKVGTFELNGREFVGLVLQDRRVIDIAPANVAFEQRNSGARKVAAPRDMKELIERYEADVGPRLRELAAANASAEAGSAAYVHAVTSLRILPPVRPAVILNAGANYPAHARGIIEQGARTAARNASAGGGSAPATGGPAPAAGGPPAANAGRPAPQVGSAPGLWERDPSDKRPDNPYLFLKSPTVVVGANDDVVVPRGRTQIDWECEFAVVVGARTKNVSTADAPKHIFGYSIEFDVSDRGGRNDRKMGGGPDWFVQKNHDTFGPLGPFIVPKEFLPNPMNTRHYFTLNGEIKQDANTSQMEYNIWEMLSYASNVLTLSPGDIVALGSPAGTNIERDTPRWMRPGDVGVCVVEGVGEQRHKIVAQE
jgi:2-keto-4-pentenoate hydratase/2-oxohepta-3-ene-1,7-dioic acid hydratase in catechol pathway